MLRLWLQRQGRQRNARALRCPVRRAFSGAQVSRSMMQMVVAGTGVRIPSDKPLYLSLTSLEGVGRRAAVGICVELELDPQMQADKMSAEERAKLCRRLSEA